VLEGKEKLLTTNNYSKGQQRYEGYNFMGSHQWFKNHDINSITEGGIVKFSDGKIGIIECCYDGMTSNKECAYIYYKCYSQFRVGF
jgi:hypothetical protein